MQPRRGSRVFLWADIQLSDDMAVRCYSLHLENFCGIAARLTQMSEVIAHFKAGERMPLLIGGDLNTLSHGIARWSAGLDAGKTNQLVKQLQLNEER
jgi:endonuclease/exonuclease/phosphatase family metal-dependent hydrolase